MGNELQAWREQRERELNIGGGLVLRYKVADIFAVLDDNGDLLNPLLPIIQGAIKGQGETPETSLFSAPDALPKLRQLINAIMVRVITFPPLVEQGHDDGISVDDLTFTEKMAVFGDVMGGEQFDAAAMFPQAQAASVDTAPDK